MESLNDKLQELGAKKLVLDGFDSFVIDKSKIIEAIELAKEAGFNLLSDIFAIDYLDYPEHEGKRFVVVYNLFAIDTKQRVFIRTELEPNEALPTASNLWSSANVVEREVFDMFGIKFSGHPNLTKLHTPDDLEGHPLLKDFPLGETATLFNDGRFIDPAAFRASLKGSSQGMTGYKGGARRGLKRVRGDD